MQDYEGGHVWLWMAEWAFGAALTGPASGVGRWLVMHTSVALAVVTMLDWPPASELGSSRLLGPWNPNQILHPPEWWMGLRDRGWLAAVLDCLMVPLDGSGSQPDTASHS